MEKELWLIIVTVAIGVVGYFVSRQDKEVDGLRKRMHNLESALAGLQGWLEVFKKKLGIGKE